MNKELQNKIAKLEKELAELKRQYYRTGDSTKTVIVPEPLEPAFSQLEQSVADYFETMTYRPDKGEISIDDERYILLRSASLSYEFIEFIKERYSDHTEKDAINIGNNFLYDNAKVIGKKDAIAFHKELKLKDPVTKLSAGPVHFAFTGWAKVEILPESNPTADDNYFLKYIHHNSFEAQSWIKAKKKSSGPVCTMNCGYSAGWCEESFGLSLTTVEVKCEAKGDDACTFIMAPSDRIEEYLEREKVHTKIEDVEIPVFFKRKVIEDKLQQSLLQKETLLKEIHHRVKNNLQIIVSLLRLQMNKVDDPKFREELELSMNRVGTMAEVHELMYREENLDKLKVKSYFKNLTDSLIQSYGVGQKVDLDIQLNIEDEEFSLEKSIPLGLILNEITCNSFKHGIANGGEFKLRLSKKNDHFELLVGDNGPGMSSKKDNNGLGISLISILADQLDAELSIDNSDKGLYYKLVFEV